MIDVTWPLAKKRCDTRPNVTVLYGLESQHMNIISLVSHLAENAKIKGYNACFVFILKILNSNMIYLLIVFKIKINHNLF